MEWKIIKVKDKYEVHNEFGYWTEFNSYTDASCYVRDKMDEFKRELGSLNQSSINQVR